MGIHKNAGAAKASRLPRLTIETLSHPIGTLSWNQSGQCLIAQRIKYMRQRINKKTIVLILMNVCVFIALWFSLECICNILYRHANARQDAIKDDLFSLLDSRNYEKDADLLFKLKPSASFFGKYRLEYVTDAQGWRTGINKKYNNALEQETRKIIVLGDSTTFGVGVAFEDAYSAVLERMINKSTNQRFCVLNYGVPGFTSFQCKKLLEKKLSSLKPYLVVCYIGANDSAPVIQYSDEEYWKFINTVNRSAIYRILQRSSVYNLLCFWKFRIKMAIIKEAISHLPQNKDWFSISLPDILLALKHQGNKLTPAIFKKQRVSPQEFQENLQSMRELAQRYNTLFIYIPCVWRTKREKLIYRKDYLNGTYLDIIQEFRKYGVNDILLDTVHLSKKGHYLIAKMIFDSLNDLSADSKQP